MKTFAILDGDMGARVRERGPMPFFDRDHWSGLLCIVIPGVCLTAFMWHEAPLWWNIVHSFGPGIMLHVIPHTAYFIAATEFFWRSCEAMEAALDGFRVVTLNPQGTDIDWEETYRNYDAMHDFVNRFAEEWEWYYFVGEFGMVLGTVTLVVALVVQIMAFIQSGYDVTAPLARVLVVLGFGLCIVFPTTALLWIFPSRVTAACERIQRQGLDTMSQVAQNALLREVAEVTSAPHAAAKGLYLDQTESPHMVRAKSFHFYMMGKPTFFGVHGFRVSFDGGMAVLYPFLTIVFGIVVPMSLGMKVDGAWL